MPVIELAQLSDLPAILELLARCGLPEAGLSERVATTLVARENGQIIGSAALELYGEAALLRSVAVDASQRGRGLGQDLTQAGLDLARARGVGQVYLLTETAGDFFPRFGFRPITRADVTGPVTQSVEFISACPASALVMTLSLEGRITGESP